MIPVYLCRYQVYWYSVVVYLNALFNAATTVTLLVAACTPSTQNPGASVYQLPVVPKLVTVQHSVPAGNLGSGCSEYPGSRCFTLETAGITSYHPVYRNPWAVFRTKSPGNPF